MPMPRKDILLAFRSYAFVISELIMMPAEKVAEKMDDYLAFCKSEPASSEREADEDARVAPVNAVMEKMSKSMSREEFGSACRQLVIIAYEQPDLFPDNIAQARSLPVHTRHLLAQVLAIEP